MPYTYSVNQAVTGFSDTVATMLATLIARGWTVSGGCAGSVSSAVIYKPDAGVFVGPPYAGPQPSSFGQQAPYTANPVGMADPVLQGAPPNSIATPLNWCIMHQPNTTRQFLFQRSGVFKFSTGPNVDTAWRIKYSPALGFTGGTTTVAASAADEVIVYGGGTDAAPTFADWMTEINAKLHTVIGDASEGNSFVMFTTIQTTPTGPDTDSHLRSIFMLDAVRGASPGDTDPVVIYIDGGGSSTVLTDSIQVDHLHNPIAMVGSSIVAVLAHTIGASFPKGLPVNPLTGNEPLTPVPWSRSNSETAPQAFKGYSTLLMWKGVNRLFFDSLNVITSKDRIIMGNVALPWAGVDVNHTAGGNANAEIIFPSTVAAQRKFFLRAHDSATPPNKVYWTSNVADITQAPVPPTPPILAPSFTVLSIL